MKSSNKHTLNEPTQDDEWVCICRDVLFKFRKNNNKNLNISLHFERKHGTHFNASLLLYAQAMNTYIITRNIGTQSTRISHTQPVDQIKCKFTVDELAPMLGKHTHTQARLWEEDDCESQVEERSFVYTKFNLMPKRVVSSLLKYCTLHSRSVPSHLE